VAKERGGEKEARSEWEKEKKGRRGREDDEERRGEKGVKGERL
jgi:hypothetical protein